MSTPVDLHVGAMIKLRRKALGLSQQAVAESLEISFQQVQKYERGGNRVSASTLWRLSEVLRCEIGYFFEGLPMDGRRDAPGEFGIIGRTFLGSDGGLDLARAYLAMPEDHRRALLAAAKSFARA